MDISARHPEYAYLDLMREILDTGVQNIDNLGGAEAVSVFGRQIRFDLSRGFPLLTTKKVYWKGVLQELYWFMSGQTNIKYLVDNGVHIWDEPPHRAYKSAAMRGEVPPMTQDEFIAKIKDDAVFAEKWGNLPRIYGEMWRRWPTKNPGRTVDQLAWAVKEIQDDPYARNAIVTSWNPEYLYHMALPEETCHFPICHNMYQLSVKNNKVSLQLYQRSADMFLGVPFNIASYALLVHVIAHVTGYEVGEFVHTFGDAHVYNAHIEQAKEQLTREPYPLSTISISPECTSIDDFRPEHVTLSDYKSHPTLKAELQITGGFFDATQVASVASADGSTPSA
ncbi:MAG TPA: thymidylate synthase [bacterium]|nr:thymidylate synthase [bacterium]